MPKKAPVQARTKPKERRKLLGPHVGLGAVGVVVLGSALLLIYLLVGQIESNNTAPVPPPTVVIVPPLPGKAARAANNDPDANKRVVIKNQIIAEELDDSPALLIAEFQHPVMNADEAAE